MFGCLYALYEKIYTRNARFWQKTLLRFLGQILQLRCDLRFLCFIHLLKLWVTVFYVHWFRFWLSNFTFWQWGDRGAPALPQVNMLWSSKGPHCHSFIQTQCQTLDWGVKMRYKERTTLGQMCSLAKILLTSTSKSLIVRNSGLYRLLPLWQTRLCYSKTRERRRRRKKSQPHAVR